MADITTSTTINQSDREVVMAFQYQYVDGANEDAVTKVDVSALAKNVSGTSCSAVRIVEVWWVLEAMTVIVESDATVDVTMMHLSDNWGYQDFSKFGGLPSTTSYGASPNGDILFTTTGAGAVGDAYQIVLRMIKQY